MYRYIYTWQHYIYIYTYIKCMSTYSNIHKYKYIQVHTCIYTYIHKHIELRATGDLRRTRAKAVAGRLDLASQPGNLLIKPLAKMYYIGPSSCQHHFEVYSKYLIL